MKFGSKLAFIGVFMGGGDVCVLARLGAELGQNRGLIFATRCAKIKAGSLLDK